MTPSQFSKLVGLSFLLLLIPPVAAATDEPASPAELAALDSREMQLRAKIDDRLQAWVTAATDDESQVLAAETTELLRHQTFGVARRDASPPPAKRAATEKHATTRGQMAGNTICAMDEDTLECMLRDHASR
jgi:hypothetical protein